MKKLTALLLAFIILLSCTGCGESEPTAPSTEVPTITDPTEPPSTQKVTQPVTAQAPTESLPEPVDYSKRNPLTGLEIDESRINSRPVAIMINNLKAALPQYGIFSADIIYEVVAEGGITRLVMVIQDPSKAGIIGSIRSTRRYYLDIAQGHDAILLHAGASDQAYSDIKNRAVSNIDGIYDSTLYYRDSYRRKNNGYEHSLMTTGERISERLSTSSMRTEHNGSYSYSQQFAPEVSLNGNPANTVSVKFSSYKTGVFEYDSESGEYLISQYGQPHMDAGTEKQISTKNLLVLYTSISQISGDSYGRMEVDLVGSGNGIYACNGSYIEIKWSKDSYTDRFVYTLPDGKELILNEGTSYVCIVGSSASVTAE